jgi:hypothetical protein
MCTVTNIICTTTSPTSNTATTPSPTATACTINYADNESERCWALVGIGSVIAAILLIAVITCMIFTATVAKGINVLIRYLSSSAGANGECDQEQQPQNEGINF